MHLGALHPSMNRALAHLEALWHRVCLALPTFAKGVDFAKGVWKRYTHDDCLSYAAGMSFWLIVSFVPLTTLLFKVLGMLLSSKAQGPQLIRTLQSVLPYIPRDFLQDSILNSRKIGGIGFSWLVLLMGSYWGVGQLDTTLSHVFGLRIRKDKQTRRRHWIRRVGLLVGGIVFMVVFLAAFVGFALRQRLSLGSAGLLGALPPMLGLLLVTLVLQHLPRCHVKFEHAFLGAAISTALWWAAKFAFGIYLNHSFTWGIMYGSLLSIIAALIFLYYSCAIFLLGAEITATFYRHEQVLLTVPPGKKLSDLLRHWEH